MTVEQKVEYEVKILLETKLFKLEVLGFNDGFCAVRLVNTSYILAYDVRYNDKFWLDQNDEKTESLCFEEVYERLSDDYKRDLLFHLDILSC